MITFEDFKKLEIKVGKVLEVDDHPNADKLYVLKVDTGEERTIVAGIKNSYSKEELIGKKIIVICNLEEKELRGVKSQGMLLASSDDKIVSVLTVDKDVKIGGNVC
jgi:methionyl-tRNA synthetase